jgi:hypothetical protein
MPAGVWTYVNQSTQLTRKIYELIPGTMYELELRYKMGTVWQPWASLVAPITFETAVVDFTFTYDIGTKFLVEWTMLPDVSSYILQYKKPADPAWITKGYYPVNSAIMNPMEEGTNYMFRVIPRYNEVSFHYSQVESTLSNYIAIATNYTSTSAAFSWMPVMNPAASDYYLQMRVFGTTPVFSYYTNTNTRTVNGLFPGTVYEYRLVVRYSNVAWGATSWRLLTNNKEETSAILPQNMLNVYPNPVSDMLTVEINSTADATNVWNLYDVNGKLVMSGEGSLNMGPNYIQIDMSSLPTGLYMMQSTFNGMVETSRILKQ